MRKKIGLSVFLVTGLSALIFSDMGDLISQASTTSTAETQKKRAKAR